jgi:hypothetical protein
MKKASLQDRYPPSEPCSCETCRNFCARPGWWSVEQAEKAIEAGYGDRMMMEIAPEKDFAVLSPAFKGCEQGVAIEECARNGCTFLAFGTCALHTTGHLPLECAFCHHDRAGQGALCHADLEADWRTPRGQALVKDWLERTRAELLGRAGGKKS